MQDNKINPKNFILNKPQEVALTTEQLKAIFSNGHIDPSEEIKSLKSVFEQETSSGNRILATLGNFSLIIGKAKSRKSFLMAMITSVYGVVKSKFNFLSILPKQKQFLLYFDTEQAKPHVQLLFKRIRDLMGYEKPDFIKVYPLRKYSTEERLSIIEYVIYNTPMLGVVIIDGIRDLITSINDEQQATMISNKLLKWSEELDIHIYVVLHQNKSDNNARGHAGTELMNKAETVLSVTKSEKDKDISIVEAVVTRNKEPETFAFEIVNDFLPELVLDFKERTQKESTRTFNIKSVENYKQIEMLNAIFSRQSEIRYGELVKELKWQFKTTLNLGCGDNKAKEFITNFKNENWIVQKNEKGPYSLADFKEVSV